MANLDKLMAEAIPADGRNGAPRSYVQWQGTTLCMDFACTCGTSAHFDEQFVFAVICRRCGTRWQLAPLVMVRRADPDDEIIIGYTIGHEHEQVERL